MEQLELSTSVEAYYSVNHNEIEGEILKVIKSAGRSGIISAEIQQALPHLAYGSVTSKFKTLEERGFIEKNGRRKGPTGRNQYVWRTVK